MYSYWGGGGETAIVRLCMYNWKQTIISELTQINAKGNDTRQKNNVAIGKVLHIFAI
jgi:hypothetical protein